MQIETNDLGPGGRIGLTGLLLLIAAWGLTDLMLDAEPWSSPHVIVELGSVVLLLGTVAYLWRGWGTERRSLRAAEGRAAANRADRDHWRARANSLLEGLGAEVDRQFERWALTPTEREVALLLLKGLGHKEVAQILGRSERTVRQHAVAVYRKSGLGGRAELSAFFLEDLLLPGAPAAPRESEQSEAS